MYEEPRKMRLFVKKREESETYAEFKVGRDVSYILILFGGDKFFGFCDVA